MRFAHNILILMSFLLLSGCQTTESTKDFGQSVLNAGKSVLESINLPSLSGSSVSGLSQSDI
ncbi:MAG: hypothetical protein MRY79_05070, partial [Alphaproteobacteria bacterium]|nr:hypothetical protein [Alphaproteobacteria bacterium]